MNEQEDVFQDQFRRLHQELDRRFAHKLQDELRAVREEHSNLESLSDIENPQVIIEQQSVGRWQASRLEPEPFENSDPRTYFGITKRGFQGLLWLSNHARFSFQKGADVLRKASQWLETQLNKDVKDSHPSSQNDSDKSRRNRTNQKNDLQRQLLPRQTFSADTRRITDE